MILFKNLIFHRKTGLFKFFVLKRIKIVLLFFTVTILTFGCGESNPKSNTSSNAGNTTPEITKIVVPDFDADSAYYFVAKQLSFGPRVPGTNSHAACALWLEQTLGGFADEVTIQEFKTRIYNNRIFDGKNIIASFKPKFQHRILLAAHWDSRPFADHDPNQDNFNTPIDGANDGASGCGVLIEIARQLHLHKPNIGIDIILFDLEDYGPPQDTQTNESTDTWGLGAQYWSNNPHKFGYTARYGILLDMVGAENATFPLEGFSMYYAPDFTKRVWEIAGKAGYGNYFVYEEGGYITDDHYFINKIIQIPTINIIHLDPTSSNGTFYDHWHTVNDNLEQIDTATLKVVGQTVIAVIFEE